MFLARSLLYSRHTTNNILSRKGNNMKKNIIISSLALIALLAGGAGYAEAYGGHYGDGSAHTYHAYSQNGFGSHAFDGRHHKEMPRFHDKHFGKKGRAEFRHMKPRNPHNGFMGYNGPAKHHGFTHKMHNNF